MFIRPFKHGDVQRMVAQPSQVFLRETMSNLQGTQFLAQGDAFTAVEGTDIVGCAGVFFLHSNYGQAWALLADGFCDKFISVHRAAKRYFDEHPASRIEAYVDIEFEPGHRWVKLLGFEVEAARVRKYRVDGGDSTLYARIK